MGNIFTTKSIECLECKSNGVEPEYFTKKPNDILIQQVYVMKTYDKYGNPIKKNSNKTTTYYYMCSNGHKITQHSS